MYFYSLDNALIDLADKPAFVGPRFVMSAHMNYGGFCERSLIDWSVGFVHPEKSFVDVGANIGTWTIMHARAGHPCFSFEPQKNCYRHLVTNTYLNQVEELCTTFNCGLGASVGTASTITTCPEGGGCMISKDLFAQLQGGVIREQLTEDTMTIRTLDDCLPVETNVGLIKIDVEGEELNVLKGATQTLERCRPFVMYEAWPWDWYTEQRQKLEFFFKSINYRVLPIAGNTDMHLAEPIL